MRNTQTRELDRYDYVVCPQCGQTWQLIDWGCARHRLTCDPPPSVWSALAPRRDYAAEEGEQV